jgi:DNA-binding CsgD family transcriptional regulator/PAS domain-containing protein
MSDGATLPPGERLTQLIGSAYTTGLEAHGWAPLAEDLRATFDSDLALVQYFDHAEPSNSFVVAAGLGHDFLDAFHRNYGGATDRDDDLIWKSVRTAPGGAVRLNVDLRSLEEARRTEIHRVLAAPWGLDYFMTGIALNTPDASTYVSLGRTGDTGCFSPLEKDLLGSGLLGHIGRSVGLHRGFAIARRQAELFGSVLDAMPDGVVVFNTEGRAILTNRAATAIFARGAALALRDDRLATPDPVLQALLDQALQESLSSVPQPTLPAPVYVTAPDSMAPALRVTFSRLWPQQVQPDVAASLPADAASLAVLCTAPGLQRSALAARYGFTPAEERLCLLLVAGRTLQEAADSLDISRNTAKTHVGRVFDKTGVRSQVALIGLLAPILTNR